MAPTGFMHQLKTYYSKDAGAAFPIGYQETLSETLLSSDNRLPVEILALRVLKRSVLQTKTDQ